MRILGIDPGSIRCGFGIIQTHTRGTQYIASGNISPPSSKPLHERLKHIHDGVAEVIRLYSPDVVVVEKIFYAKSIRAAMSLGYARAVVLLAIASGCIPLQECSALEVKKAVVGYGRAEKDQVQKMVKLILNIKGSISPDSADALGLALCYANTIKFNTAVKDSKM